MKKFSANGSPVTREFHFCVYKLKIYIRTRRTVQYVLYSMYSIVLLLIDVFINYGIDCLRLCQFSYVIMAVTPRIKEPQIWNTKKKQHVKNYKLIINNHGLPKNR